MLSYTLKNNIVQSFWLLTSFFLQIHGAFHITLDILVNDNLPPLVLLRELSGHVSSDNNKILTEQILTVLLT